LKIRDRFAQNLKTRQAAKVIEVPTNRLHNQNENLQQSPGKRLRLYCPYKNPRVFRRRIRYCRKQSVNEDRPMSSALPAILLDLDGTLIASEPGILSSCRAALRVLGHETDPAMDIASIIGPPIEDVMRYLLGPFGDDRVTEGVDAYRQDYGARGLLLSEVYNGIPEALLAMSQSAKLYLATSKRETFARRILENKKLDAKFAGIYGSTPAGNIDHKPELIAHIVRENNLDRDRCVMVGDRRYDIAGAHANGIRAIGVLWGYGSKEELESAGADLFIETAEDLAPAADGLIVPQTLGR
jgi:phosphoglycolate phosphatase